MCRLTHNIGGLHHCVAHPVFASPMTRILFLIQNLSYFLRATVGRRLTDITKELDLLVHTLSSYPELNSSIKMEVGIEDCLHIEFEYNKSKYVVALEMVRFQV